MNLLLSLYINYEFAILHTVIINVSNVMNKNVISCIKFSIFYNNLILYFIISIYIICIKLYNFFYFSYIVQVLNIKREE